MESCIGVADIAHFLCSEVVPLEVQSLDAFKHVQPIDQVLDTLPARVVILQVQ